MANRIIDDVNLKNIANAIRNKKGTANQMLPSQMANEISSIKTATSSGGTFQWTDNTALGSFMHDATYNWIAVGN
jgi:hypothetical protein